MHYGWIIGILLFVMSCMFCLLRGLINRIDNRIIKLGNRCTEIEMLSQSIYTDAKQIIEYVQVLVVKSKENKQ